MKALTTFQDLGTVTSSGEAAGYPATNIEDLDPGLVWKADAYAGDVWLKCDLGSAKALTALFVNRANFPELHIQGHASDSWGSPSFDLECDLVQDDAGNRKGWFDLTAFNYQWVRILIPSGQALDSGTVPEVGNVILGASAALPIVRDFTVDLARKIDSWLSDGGSLRKNFRGVPRHILTLEMGDTMATIRAMVKTWEQAVLFADLGDAGGAWLVYAPDRITLPIRNPIDAGARMQLEERV